MQKHHNYNIQTTSPCKTNSSTKEKYATLRKSCNESAIITIIMSMKNQGKYNSLNVRKHTQYE